MLPSRIKNHITSLSLKSDKASTFRFPLWNPDCMSIPHTQRKNECYNNFTEKNLSSISTFDGKIEVWK